MFKVGDDFRQDQLTLQVIRVMESFWRKGGTDYHMRYYEVLLTRFEQGFIKVVSHAVTGSPEGARDARGGLGD
jgi:phosphatidylinositol-4,5-bisphosphate 3-kinase